MMDIVVIVRRLCPLVNQSTPLRHSKSLVCYCSKGANVAFEWLSWRLIWSHKWCFKPSSKIKFYDPIGSR